MINETIIQGPMLDEKRLIFCTSNNFNTGSVYKHTYINHEHSNYLMSKKKGHFFTVVVYGPIKPCVVSSN